VPFWPTSPTPRARRIARDPSHPTAAGDSPLGVLAISSRSPLPVTLTTTLTGQLQVPPVQELPPRQALPHPPQL